MDFLDCDCVGTRSGKADRASSDLQCRSKQVEVLTWVMRFRISQWIPPCSTLQVSPLLVSVPLVMHGYASRITLEFPEKTNSKITENSFECSILRAPLEYISF